MIVKENKADPIDTSFDKIYDATGNYYTEIRTKNILEPEKTYVVILDVDIIEGKAMNFEAGVSREVGLAMVKSIPSFTDANFNKSGRYTYVVNITEEDLTHGGEVLETPYFAFRIRNNMEKIIFKINEFIFYDGDSPADAYIQPLTNIENNTFAVREGYYKDTISI